MFFTTKKDRKWRERMLKWDIDDSIDLLVAKAEASEVALAAFETIARVKARVSTDKALVKACPELKGKIEDVYGFMATAVTSLTEIEETMAAVQRRLYAEQQLVERQDMV